MWRYAQAMHAGSVLYMSGFYTEDIDVLKAEAERHSLRFVRSDENNRWAMMELVKE
jgi:ribosomal protein L11 methyltransferase